MGYCEIATFLEMADCRAKRSEHLGLGGRYNMHMRYLLVFKVILGSFSAVVSK